PPLRRGAHRRPHRGPEVRPLGTRQGRGLRPWPRPARGARPGRPRGGRGAAPAPPCAARRRSRRDAGGRSGHLSRRRNRDGAPRPRIPGIAAVAYAAFWLAGITLGAVAAGAVLRSRDAISWRASAVLLAALAGFMIGTRVQFEVEQAGWIAGIP